MTNNPLFHFTSRIKYLREICMDTMARLSARHCKRPYRCPAHILSTTSRISNHTIFTNTNLTKNYPNKNIQYMYQIHDNLNVSYCTAIISFIYFLLTIKVWMQLCTSLEICLIMINTTKNLDLKQWTVQKI